MGEELPVIHHQDLDQVVHRTLIILISSSADISVPLSDFVLFQVVKLKKDPDSEPSHETR